MNNNEYIIYNETLKYDYRLKYIIFIGIIICYLSIRFAPYFVSIFPITILIVAIPCILANGIQIRIEIRNSGLYIQRFPFKNSKIEFTDIKSCEYNEGNLMKQLYLLNPKIAWADVDKNMDRKPLLYSTTSFVFKTISSFVVIELKNNRFIIINSHSSKKLMELINIKIRERT